VNPDLETLLSADEEARARVEAGPRGGAGRPGAAPPEEEGRRKDRARARQAALEREVRAIAEDAARRVEARRARRAEYVSTLTESAAGLLPAAVEAWVRIVRDGPPETGPSR
jgi:hypothetical protein